MHLPRALCTAAVSRLSALEPISDPESLSEAVLIAEAELASEAARPNPRTHASCGTKACYVALISYGFLAITGTNLQNIPIASAECSGETHEPTAKSHVP